MPALADVLLEFIERAEAKLPLQLRGVSLFGRQHLTQSVDLLLHLTHNRPTRNSSVWSFLFTPCTLVKRSLFSLQDSLKWEDVYVPQRNAQTPSIAHQSSLV